MPRVNEENMPSPIEALCAENNKLRQQRADLLEALKYAKDTYDFSGELSAQAMRKIDAAITKAEAAE